MLASLLDPELPYAWLVGYVFVGLVVLGIILVPLAWLYDRFRQRRPKT